jgi:sarcosine oxidase delta subunit
MLTPFLSISKFSIVCALSIGLGLVVVNPASAGAESRDQYADEVTDLLFYRMNPELHNRQLDSEEVGYAREWQVLRNAVYQEIKPASEVCFRSQSTNTFEFASSPKVYDEIADTIYHHRNPDRRGAKIHQNDRSEQKKWSKIRSVVHVYNCGM